MQVSATRYRVTMWTAGCFPAARDNCDGPPVAAWEVLSPEDSYMRVARKLAAYAAMGIGEIWVLDPESGVFKC